MNTIRVNVNRQLDGYTFSISPSTRNFIKEHYETANPANGIFVAYDVKSDFESYYGQLENFICPPLLGIANIEELAEYVDYIEFYDTSRSKVLHRVEPKKVLH